MPIKSLFILPVFIVTLKMSGQKIELRNLTVSDESSKTIYLDMQNKFKIPGFIDQVNTETGNTICTVHEDTMVLIPTTKGNVTISFATKYGPQQMVFTAKTLPPMTISVGSETNNKLISKTAFLKNGKIFIKKNDIFFDGYIVDSSVVTLNGQVYLVNSDQKME